VSLLNIMTIDSKFESYNDKQLFRLFFLFLFHILI
jgi:hypothetical protein